MRQDAKKRQDARKRRRGQCFTSLFLASWHSWRLGALHFLFLTTLLASLAAGPASWPTNRGNLTRTGSIDDQPGPKAPKVRWVYKAQENFIASPVPAAKALYVSGLGAFNTAAFHALALEGDSPDRVMWSKSAPFIKLPTVCAPSVADGLLVFGDGMHQTDGAILYALREGTGRPVWQYEVPGKLVHMEGGPTLDKGRAYIGAGDGGLLCVDVNRVTLDGRETDAKAASEAIEKKWAELFAKYEQEKKVDPTFAVPPSDDALPKPKPKLVWQVGPGKYHVDAAVAVAGERLLAASSYIDEDKAGRRVMLCLNAADGKVLWEVGLKVNPWGGPTIVGDTVIIGCSSIRFDRKKLREAKGEVVALDLNTGNEKWRKELPGGVLSPVAVKNNLAVFAATDGKVRALAVSNGDEKWSYDGATPFFAGPAVAGDAVYAPDLKGVMHALSLADGKKLWAFDVTGDPAVQAPGMVFGSPVVHGGEIYLATNNLEGGSAEMPSVVVCLSDRASLVKREPAAAVSVDAQNRTVTVPCRIAPRKLPNLKEVYPLEVVATYPAPRGQKAHETVINFDVNPSDVHKALEGLGLKPGKPARGEGAAASGPEVGVWLEVAGVTGKPRKIPLERALVDRRTGLPMPALKWHFTGSAMRQADPEKPEKLVYGADLTGTLISIFPVTDETVIQTNLTMHEEPLLKLDTNRNVLPDEGTEARLVIQVK